ncbi:GNAT family N-acetyltransferase [Clostridium sp. CF012]|uniref:GNAT family N-acetyltransferase n=1 Tax=Clostridium sp. CF012 TaxID=2843319 RepID=UPI001C0E89EF|nr:GNAT family N-acetyltransferase [Clostridium sp. CF012]MBU3144034.1 GNAT family N-acetyltransferase [Clostridium sp. CF012]
MDDHQHTITMKLELNKEQYKAIKSLEAVCYEKQKTNLKLELDFKMHQRKNSIKNKIMAEFLYYDNEILVGYLGLCNFHGTSVEVSGMVHPEFRRKGIFKKLYLLAQEEWQKLCPSEVLVLCDHTSLSGLAFINSIGAEYGSSEYKMCLNNKTLEDMPNHVIKLRVATNEDNIEIERQSSIYFGFPEKEADNKEDIENISIQVDDNFISYIAELAGEIIGKVHISTTDNEGFIHGFGVLPEYRGKGYGREVLCLAMDILKKKQVDNIFLEVATENKKALGLYESCGFEEISVMDYYIVS